MKTIYENVIDINRELTSKEISLINRLYSMGFKIISKVMFSRGKWCIDYSEILTREFTERDFDSIVNTYILYLEQCKKDLEEF